MAAAAAGPVARSYHKVASAAAVAPGLAAGILLRYHSYKGKEKKRKKTFRQGGEFCELSLSKNKKKLMCTACMPHCCLSMASSANC